LRPKGFKTREFIHLMPELAGIWRNAISYGFNSSGTDFMELMSIVGIVLIVIAALVIKKVVGFMFKSLMFIVLLAGVYFFLGPYFGLPVPNF